MTDKKKETIGVVLLNLGGPDSLSAVRPFLYNLFSDREIIRLGPPFLQKPLAWLISTLRSKKTEKMYSLIGGKSPIVDITRSQAQALEKTLNSSQFTVDSSRNFRVYIGMRYWHPFIGDAVDEILKNGVKHIIVLSLYPHYSKATTGSSISEFKRAIKGVRGQGAGIKIQYIEQWYDFPHYIETLTGLISRGISEINADDINIIYSAHSLPEDFINKGDPYLEHIKATIEAVNSLLVTRYPVPSGTGRRSSPIKWHLSFQSRSGPVKWLKPSTDETIIRLAKTGSKNLLVVPISFVSDHIETLYEIDILYKELARKHGVNLKRCQSLNTSGEFINTLKELVMTKLG